MTEVFDGKWLSSRLTGRRGEKQELADKLGIDKAKLSKVLHGRRQLKPAEIAKAIDFFESLTAAPPMAPAPKPPGFSEGDVAPLSPRSESKIQQLLTIGRQLAPGTRSPSILQASRNLPWAALRFGDFLIIDLKPQPNQGDLVICQISNADYSEATTSLRQWLPPFVVIPDQSEEDAVLPADNDRVALMATVTAVLRAPELS